MKKAFRTEALRYSRESYPFNTSATVQSNDYRSVF